MILSLKQAERYKAVIERFAAEMPSPHTELHYSNPYQLLVAVILSAQCTDKRVNMITPAFFEAYPDAESLASAPERDIYAYIRSCSYPNNKARSLSGMARRLVADYGGVIPGDIDSLMSLPGVGRKTANVILSVIFNRPAMAVDTHVFRVAERIGLTTRSRNPLTTERQLTAQIPEEVLSMAHHWLILHGRYVCKARKPQCGSCFLSDLCRYRQREIKASVRAEVKPSRRAAVSSKDGKEA